MQSTAIDLMREQVRAIYRAATGSELVEAETASDAEVPLDDVALRFADLEAMVRSIPGVAERVPPFSFTPLIDVIENDHEWAIEVAVPGADPEDVSVEIAGDTLIVSGARRGLAEGGRTYLHAEIPRGPFRRSIQLPESSDAEPRVDVQRGVISIHVPKAKPGGAARSNGRSSSRRTSGRRAKRK